MEFETNTIFFQEVKNAVNKYGTWDSLMTPYECIQLIKGSIYRAEKRDKERDKAFDEWCKDYHGEVIEWQLS